MRARHVGCIKAGAAPDGNVLGGAAMWRRRQVAHCETLSLAFCDMKTLYLRNVPDEVGERLERLAAREGMSVSAFATRELAMIARRESNPALLAHLPDLGVGAGAVVGDVEAGRSER